MTMVLPVLILAGALALACVTSFAFSNCCVVADITQVQALTGCVRNDVTAIAAATKNLENVVSKFGWRPYP